MRYRTIDRCNEPGCRCEDRAGVILYDGDDREEAEAAKAFARYADPFIEEMGNE
jgi:hypothetical protein